VGQGSAVGPPLDPGGNRGLGLVVAVEPTTEAEVSGAQADLVDVGPRGRAIDGADRIGVPDRVGETDERQDRHVDVGKGHQHAQPRSADADEAGDIAVGVVEQLNRREWLTHVALDVPQCPT